jgi:hypothetical protein
MNKVTIPETYQYIGVFLTLSCNLSCSYCINHLVGLKSGRKLLSAKEWQKAFSRLDLARDIPLTLQGGEPSVHKEFYEVMKSIPSYFKIDLLTNIQFDLDVFRSHVPPQRLNRDSPYAPIRVSYHPETMNFIPTRDKVLRMMDLGYQVGLYGVLHPLYEEEILRAQADCLKLGIDFRTKEFLGIYEGKIYGNYLYPDAVFSENLKNCFCKTTELLIDPFGDVFRCHHDLYNKLNPLGNILGSNFNIQDISRPCSSFGNCNPCDVKVKNNYKQEFGHTSVSIEVV